MANDPLKTAVVTDIGKAKLDAAYQAGEKVIISQMALGNSNLAYVVPDPAFTELVNEFGRQDINEGNTTDSWINALVYVDSQQFAGKSILEFGLYDTDGDLIVYSSYTPSVVPAVGQDYIQLEIECSVDLYNASAVTIEVTPIYPQATELERGIAKVATDDDVAAGIDDEKIVTPKKLVGQYLTRADFLKHMLFKGMPMSAVGPDPDPDIWLPAGRVELLRADYPTVFEIVSASDFFTDQALIDADPRAYAGHWGTGNGETTFTTDDWALMMNIKVAGGYGAAGSTKEDHLQNITGSIASVFTVNNSFYSGSANGALSVSNLSGANSNISVGTTGDKIFDMYFDASNVARTDTYTDTMGLFLDHYRVIPKGTFSYA